MLEAQFQSKTELPFVNTVTTKICDAGYTGKIVQVVDASVRVQHHVRDVPAGVGEVRRVAEVERLHPELQLEPLGKPELAVDSEIPVNQAGAADGPETG